MIKKQSLFYGLTLLLVTFLGQQTYAMKGFAPKASNGFRLGMKALNYAGVIGYFGYTVDKVNKERQRALISIKDYNEDLSSRDPLLGLSEQSAGKIIAFIKNAYPELNDTKIQIIENNSFGAMYHNNTAYISVAFNEREYRKACALKEKNVLGYTRKVASNERWKERLTLPEYISKCELEGKAMTPTTINLWQGVLLHEGSHILHYDPSTVYNPTPHILVLLGTEKIKKIVGLTSLKYPKNITANNMIRGIGSIVSLPLKVAACGLLISTWRYWHEYRADQDAIKRTQNPNLLKAISSNFATLPQPCPVTIPEKINYYLGDSHLNFKTRAQYFADAAQKLEKKQALIKRD
ncbi:MAG: hypothetical protein AB7F19_06665 [Candidatus Babeliales bacterium]